ncbi:hypothetical protein FHL04_02880 [Lactobacillus salsicarnum]|nr:hypothetical protein [Companilactobacillus mishanensis]
MSAKTKSGYEGLTFSKAGKYRLTVSRNGIKKSKHITIKPRKMDIDDLLADTDTDSSDETNNTSDSTNSGVSKEYKAALNKAQSYSDDMDMSKQGIYDQLTSEYGEQFPADAAQYAIDNLKADYNANALKKAKSYQDDQDMSTEGIRDQLVSEYGEQFTQDEANYAIAHLNDE